MSESVFSTVDETPPVDDDSRLRKLLQEFQLESVFDYLKAAQVSYRSLQYMQAEDIKEAIPPLGLRIEFREKLFTWKKVQFGIDDETISVQSKVDNWLKEKEFHGKHVLNKSLVNILKEYPSARPLLEHKNKNKNLTTDHRNSLIKIIVEEAVSNQIPIRIQDFPILLNEIVSVFPSEKDVQDYYFIRRGEKGSPSGKLYSKYKNFRAKRLKYDNKASIGDASNERKSSSDQLSSQIYENIEVDESIASALKVSLNRDSADWSDVCEKWKKTFHLRRQELSELNSGAFLESWSKFSHQKAADLIQIDFELLYPGKSHMLFSKWQNFKGKILGYYERNVTNEACKQQISKAKETQQIGQKNFEGNNC
ncbi:uncharacterized protein LOC101889627 isoform X3 [Musca domestica]|uniref:Uncharacterized protein LOC101889627 isoform X3 n=1 Tax=Musca domestica TaxID=7370 RepID=A0ABM3V710_MUSDO|nr:uncharacterized protein LOC131801866 isoform X4 [Musca domestica]XP_058981569.1 uncharacterized protein LOC105262100 isoform X3 [Musca domestica]XP_058981877.1 uncharacterized protein LOC101889627 isoform X3 [Musca domestica]